MSRADKTVTRCTFEIDLDPATRIPRTIHLTLLTGVLGGGGRASRDRAFEEGVEHMAFHYVLTIDADREIAEFEIPKEAGKLLR